MNHTTWTVHFSGESIATTVTDMASRVDEWVNDVRSMQGRLIVGLDCEWKPHPIREMSNKTATLQLCIQNKCLIAQIFYMAHIPESLKSFMSDPSVTFVGVGVGQDVAKLRDEYGLVVSNAVDLEPLAMARMDSSIFNYRRPGLKGFAREIAGLHMEKPRHVTMSNWETRVLSRQQIEYACIDAYASHKIGYKLLVENYGVFDLDDHLNDVFHWDVFNSDPNDGFDWDWNDTFDRDLNDGFDWDWNDTFDPDLNDGFDWD